MTFLTGTQTPSDREAAARRTGKAGALNTLGMRAVQRGDFAGAAALFRQAVDADPASAEAQYNLARALKDAGKVHEALDAFRRVVALHPSDADAWYTMGNTCAALDAHEEAERAYRRALELQPEDVRIYNNLTVTLQAQGRLDEAAALAAVGLAIDPGYGDLHYNRGLVLLLRGEFAEAWREFEHRFTTSDRTNPARPDVHPRWDGSSVAGRTILLAAEQGLGDTIQFVRFAGRLKERGARVVVECATELVTLLLSAPGVDAVVPRGSALPPYDVWTPLLSLPFHLGFTDERSLAVPVPYLSPDPARAAAWRERVAAHRGQLRAGCVWAGNPAHRNDRNRSCAPGDFTGLASIPGTVWFSLQRPGDAGRADRVPEGCHDLMTGSMDLADTAAFIMALDLVVTVDTAVAHLAGAMGKPVWLLVPFAPDWRWMLHREDTPWYPTMRLFRQDRRGSWSGVFDRVAACVRRLIAHHPETADAVAGMAPARRQQTVPAEEPGALLAYADALCHAGLRRHAIDVYRRFVALRADVAGAWNNLGVCLQQEGETAGAIGAYERATALEPGDAVMLNNFGFALGEFGVRRRAIEVLRGAVHLDPGLAEAHNNLGNVLRADGDRDGARRAYEAAITARPGFPEPHWNLAQLLLQSGEFARGWEEYEWRWRRPDFTSPLRHFPQPLWQGEEISGKTILIHAEQGFGDALQFVRYLALLQRTGARIILECQPQLVRLFLGLPMVHAVIGTGGPLPPFDVHCPMLSLPGIFRTTRETIPAETPYLTVHGADLRHWRVRCGGDGLAVGIVWSGAQRVKTLRNRSCSLVEMTALFQVRGIRLYSLQFGEAGRELDQVPAAVRPVDLAPELRDFADTAAAVSMMDLIVTIDTSVAHLAGALAKPVWVMLTEDPDWRWMCDREDSPWYPGMRLFRRRAGEAWSGVVGRVAGALQDLVRTRQEGR